MSRDGSEEKDPLKHKKDGVGKLAALSCACKAFRLRVTSTFSKLGSRERPCMILFMVMTTSSSAFLQSLLCRVLPHGTTVLLEYTGSDSMTVW